ncbi:LTA synthase family protein [Burkholderia diffusa]|uniref:LTA synthase family protein n=1 Tax=Burkholderia diffusa TaxID=488732 RepID=UPI0007578066|nr:LTA synthase family protein [Burkholderia diffusa]KVH43889.1 capsular biosynthesis protein [Burkholderia diffusa]
MVGSFPTLVIGVIAVSFGADALAMPRSGWRRAPIALALHLASVSFVGCFVLAVTHRVYFSAFVSVALVALLAGISNAKYKSLWEPIVFTDLSLFSQIFAHPRLYLPFLNISTVAAIGLGIVAIVVGFMADPARSGIGTHALVAAMLSLAASYILAEFLPLVLDASKDQLRHGFFAVFVAYLLKGFRISTVRKFEQTLCESPFVTGAPAECPDVIVIQSESYFDARRVSSAISNSLYANLDRARREAVYYGKLSVPAWGANTMRTEFSVLTGLASNRLGYARFYPYAFLRRPCASLASWFKRGGYETVAIHPYHAAFFDRDRVFPLLQFERFIDINQFSGAQRIGAYVSDAAVAGRIIETLDGQGRKPQFLYVMTMENHGPLHLETVRPHEAASRHTLGDDVKWRDLTAYLRHVENADAMIGRLLDYLHASNRETVVCFYGDHVPAIPEVFGKLGVNPQQSDYFIWRNFNAGASTCRDLPAESLGALLLNMTQESGDREEKSSAPEKASIK